jgi:Ca-activated chloride channel homolog
MGAGADALAEVAVTFAAPLWLAFLPVLLGGTALLLRQSHRRRNALLRAALATPLRPHLLASLDPRRRWFKQILVMAALAAITLALARPQWGQDVVKIERTGVDLLLALDVSRSMSASDVEGTNRLAAARAAVRNLLARLGGDRVGLIVFAGEAFVAAPLTRDHVAVERALDSLSSGTVSEPGSDLAKAIARAREGFARGGEGPHVLLLISDGEQLRGDSAAAARAAVAAGIAVHCAGVGSATGARVPAPGGFVRNAFGREVVSRMDERVLQQTASAGRGLYVRVPRGDSDVLADWFARACAGLPRSTEIRELGEPRERFQWPLAAALGLLGGEWLLGERRRRPKGAKA